MCGALTDWLTVIISSVAVVVAIFAFKASRASNETAAMQVYFEAYRRFHDMDRDYQIEYEKDDSVRESTEWKIKYKYALMEYYNAVDYVCAKYLFDRISKKSFAESMKNEIQRLWSGEKARKTLDIYGLSRDQWANIGKAYQRMKLDNSDRHLN